MLQPRRDFLYLSAGSLIASAAPRQVAALVEKQARFKAVVFDAFPIFDPRPVASLAEALFPAHGKALSNTWQTKQFEYQWLRALSGHYVDFWQATADSLVYAAKSLKLNLSAVTRDRLMSAYSELMVWPDAPSALGTLSKAGIRLVILSNMTQRMLEEGLQRSNLTGLFEHVLSTDRIRCYKPDPRAYQMAADALKLTREEILFAPFAGWDAAGSKWFGYPTFWVNRIGSPPEELGVTVDAAGPDLSALVKYAALPPKRHLVLTS